MNEKLKKITEEYFSQFDGIDTDKYYMCLYEDNRGIGFKMVSYLAQFADECREINLLFPEDENKGYMALVDKDNEDLVGLMSRFQVGMDFKQLGVNMGSRDGQFKKTVIDNGYFDNVGEIDEYYRDLYFPRMRDIANPSIIFSNRFFPNALRYKEILKGLKWAMTDDGTLDAPTWKSEFSLFLLTEEYFDDVIYQYRTGWLGMQSLDIFIPSVNVGIEYQGKQHYEPVEFFGGIERFLEGQARDEKKRALCKEHGVTLIEWPYTVEVEANHLVSAFAEKGIAIQKKRTRNQIKHGDYISGSDLLKKSDYTEGSVEDNVLKAINNKDVVRLFDYSKKAAQSEDIDKLKGYIEAIAQSGNQKIINSFIGAAVRDVEYRDSLMPYIASNNTFVETLLNDTYLNYVATTMIAYILKNGEAKRATAWTHKLLEKEYDNEIEVSERSKGKRKPQSRDEIRNRKIGQLPRDMWEIEVPYEMIEEFCSEMDIQFKPRKYYVNKVTALGDPPVVYVGDVEAFRHEKSSDSATEHTVENVKFKVTETNENNEIFVCKVNENGTLVSADVNDIFAVSNYMFMAEMEKEMDML